ncbi:hypothetical protein FKM82_008062 [Ascaphus truei]
MYCINLKNPYEKNIFFPSVNGVFYLPLNFTRCSPPKKCICPYWAIFYICQKCHFRMQITIETYGDLLLKAARIVAFGVYRGTLLVFYVE